MASQLDKAITSWLPDPEQADALDAQRSALALTELAALATQPWSDADLTAEDRRALARES